MRNKEIIIFLENHNCDFSIREIAKKELGCEKRECTCVLAEENFNSLAMSALEFYLRELKKLVDKNGRAEETSLEEVVNNYGKNSFENLLKLASRSEWFWKEQFKRELDLIEASYLSCSNVSLAPIDCRMSKKALDDFYEQDLFFPKRLVELLETGKKDFYEEHAFRAWYTKKQVDKYEHCDKILLTVGLDHGASLSAYLRDKNLKFIKLPFSEKEEVIENFKLSLDNLVLRDYLNSSEHASRLFSFFIPEFR